MPEDYMAPRRLTLECYVLLQARGWQKTHHHHSPYSRDVLMPNEFHTYCLVMIFGEHEHRKWVASPTAHTPFLLFDQMVFPILKLLEENGFARICCTNRLIGSCYSHTHM